MREDLMIRREAKGDHAAAARLLDAAFGIPDGRATSLEHELVAGLRADDSVIEHLTFVAELDGEVVGHVVCSRASLGEVDAVGLGPLAVRPDHQRQGIGAALMMAVVASAESAAEPAIVLLGDPDYYGFFGFVPAASHGIGSPGPWGEEYFQALTLRAWDPGMAGRFRYAPAFERLT